MELKIHLIEKIHFNSHFSIKIIIMLKDRKVLFRKVDLTHQKSKILLLRS
jgi:hypothetical protein